MSNWGGGSTSAKLLHFDIFYPIAERLHNIRTMSPEPIFLVRLPVTDVEVSVKWYTSALGFNLGSHNPGRHAHIYLGGPSAKESRTQLMLYAEKEGMKINECSLMWDVSEKGKGKEVVDEWWEKVKRTGVEVRLHGDGVEDKEWGFRQFDLRDPDGHWVTFFAYI
ncbi:hypothetical protein CALVIDRAFT_563548 [Calocera viscosa TUFC12733]|uniref:VOC domain-containing protein n=1 Tax=Calocera viscosa (strain TUFC12733) TaxID=1330018 RepID=A0A167MNT9_CALVF|nr:hypothetical protein CALVIDRAFT_563548 [Calocera viscosa TUFC12733]